MNLDLCRDWKFSREGGASVRIDIPHDAMLTEKRNAECRNGVNTGYFPGGKYIYEKAFFLDESLIGKSVVLHFEGVYQNCRVCLNGVQVGAHRYGYTPFNVDISDAVQSGENLLRVMVDNSLEPNCRWYSGSGIYRPVSLIIREKNHICDILLETVDTCPARVRVTVRTTQKSNVKVEFYDGEALVVSGVPGIIEIPDGKLWSAEEPFLYDVRIKTDSDEQIIPFGIRKLEWNPQNGLTVNGKRVLLQGGCIHHDHGILGACEYPDAEERRIRILKENGYNAIRMAHNPASQITLNTCDKLGMYVMNEAFDGWYTPKTYHDYSRWFETDWKEDLCAMVRASHNHPSVILYCFLFDVLFRFCESLESLCGWSVLWCFHRWILGLCGYSESVYGNRIHSHQYARLGAFCNAHRVCGDDHCRRSRFRGGDQCVRRSADRPCESVHGCSGHGICDYLDHDQGERNQGSGPD